MRREKILNRHEVTESLGIPKFFAKETRVAELKIANAALKLSETGLLKCDTTRKYHFFENAHFPMVARVEKVHFLKSALFGNLVGLIARRQPYFKQIIKQKKV